MNSSRSRSRGITGGDALRVSAMTAGSTKKRQPLRYHAACTCGWKSASRVNPHDAVTLAENHLHNRHPYNETVNADVVSTGGDDD